MILFCVSFALHVDEDDRDECRGNEDSREYVQEWWNDLMLPELVNFNYCMITNRVIHNGFKNLDLYLKINTRPGEYERMIVSARCHFFKLLNEYYEARETRISKLLTVNRSYR
ncbi:hypothetical protein RF11_08277 [Thelohanellus kitauei]|uniref:Uncharacterized protein n=1 Tax=Thelohanellus kitauei TaxID=669202 RepID=A0A0C2MN42_THEKT|nr:hypothetical protein RF11_08277 [Thelohanellus kitauei]